MRPQRRRTITGEILGRWVIAFALVPVGMLVLAFTHGRVNGTVLIVLVAAMVVIALIRGQHSGRRR